MIVLKYNKAILGSFLGLFNSKLMTSTLYVAENGSNFKLIYHKQ